MSKPNPFTAILLDWDRVRRVRRVRYVLEVVLGLPCGWKGIIDNGLGTLERECEELCEQRGLDWYELCVEADRSEIGRGRRGALPGKGSKTIQGDGRLNGRLRNLSGGSGFGGFIDD